MLLDLVSTKRLPPRLSVSELHRWQVKTNLYILQEGYWGRLAAWQSAVCSALCCNTLPPSCMTPAQIPRTGLLYSHCYLIQCENTNNSQKSHQQMLRFYVWHTDGKTVTKRFESETHVKNQRGSLFVLWQSESLLDFFLLFWDFLRLSLFSYCQNKITHREPETSWWLYMMGMVLQPTEGQSVTENKRVNYPSVLIRTQDGVKYGCCSVWNGKSWVGRGME